MKVFCTGITDSETRSYLDKTIKLAELNDKKIKLYDTGELIPQFYEYYGIKRDMKNILNVDDNELAILVGSIYREIKHDMKNYENVLVKGHSTFFWNKQFRHGTKWDYIESFDPKFFVTLIDSPKKIKEKLDKNEQWKNQQLTLDEICLWQNVEVINTEVPAEIKKKPSHIITRDLSDTTLYKLMFHPELKTLYLSFPISHFKKDKKIEEDINSLFNLANKYFVVTNPLGLGVDESANSKVQDEQVIFYCSRWSDKADITLQYIPSNEIFTHGVVSEGKESFQKTRETWMVFPSEKYGQFEKHFSFSKFKSIPELENYLKENYKPVDIKRK